jgi:hypothetical protein
MFLPTGRITNQPDRVAREKHVAATLKKVF